MEDIFQVQIMFLYIFKVILNLWDSKERCKWCWPSKLAVVMSQLA